MPPSPDLFGVDPAEFVSARDALARALKADGKRDEAAAVKALRRPPVPVWALNQVARAHPDVVAALFAASEDARRAQDEVLGGADREILRESLAQRRQALTDVARLARDVVAQSGRSAAGQEREIESALNAVVASEQLASRLRQGELVDLGAAEAEDSGLTALLSASVQSAPPEAEPDTKALRAQVKKLRTKADEAAQRLAATEQTLDEASRELAEARLDLARVEKEAKVAERARDEARQRSEDAAAALEDAEKSLRRLDH